jgi:glutamate dehydrogenase
MVPPDDKLKLGIQNESKKFEIFYRWLEAHMPPSFFEEVDHENILLVTHSLMGFDLQDYFSHIHLKHSALALCLDSPDADLRILKHYQMYGIKNYRSFVSNAPLPFPKAQAPLRVAVIGLTEFSESAEEEEPSILSEDKKKEIFKQLKARNPKVHEKEFNDLIHQLNARFLRALPSERLILALDKFFRAKYRDNCQFEVRYNEDWKEKDSPSLQIVFAWRNVPKYNFLYRMAKTIHRHKLSLKRVNAIYIDPYSRQNILLMSLGIHGINGKAAWEEADIADFLQEFVTLKYFEGMESIESTYVDSGLLSGNLGNLVKTIVYFVHQVLVHSDINMYSFSHIEEGLCRHPELVVLLMRAFEHKFHPEKTSLDEYEKTRNQFLELVEQIDTGNEINDTRRKNVLRQAMHFVEFALKTNFYRENKTAFCFRLDPQYLDRLPFDRKEKFPELPYAVYFMKGFHFLGFHIRFKDLSRGGLRTVTPERKEQMVYERNHVFSECYNLAYTQHKKNKDIPEGGAKGVIFLEPYERISSEKDIFLNELEDAGITGEEAQQLIKIFLAEQKLEHLHQAQRSYIESFLTLLNCHPDGTLKAKRIVDYWKKPEYIYLGPDENMHNEMIEWIASYSKYYDYKPGGAFISSKPSLGINHKEFGVTSYGVNVYMEETLRYLGIDPTKDTFTVKMSGGPDGDVAGNQMMNLHRFYPKTARLLATIDVSGTIFDPEGLDLEEVAKLFQEQKPIRFYPPQKLSDGGFLLDTRTKREQTAYTQQTLCWRKIGGKLMEDWLSGNEMNYLLRHNVHQVKADIFIPGGGRPRTLNEANFKDFLDEAGKPTAKAIVEGANLYLTPLARRALEKLGTLIIKDSSSNKGGVICSSFEVLSSLCLNEKEFLAEKPALVQEILEIIGKRAKEEAQLLLRSHQTSQAFLTDISEWISERINSYMYELLDYLQPITLSNDPSDPLIRALLNYCPPLLRQNYTQRILKEIPDIHKKAIIACHIASRLVYHRGLGWSPSVVDVLPLIAQDPYIVGST